MTTNRTLARSLHFNIYKSFQVGLCSCHLDIPNLDEYNGNGHKVKKDAISQDAIHGVVQTRVILRE